MRTRLLVPTGWLFLLLAVATAPFWIGSSYALQVLTLVLINWILLIGLDVALGHAGLVSVAHGAIYGVGAYTTAILMTDYGFNFFVTLPVSIALGVGTGLMLGLLTLRLDGHYFIIASLGFALLFGVLAENWTGLTHGGTGIAGIPGVGEIGFGRASLDLNGMIGMFYLILVSAVLAGALVTLFLRTHVGRRLRAIRENPALAGAVGISSNKARLIALCASGGIAAFAGALAAIQLAFVNPQIADFFVGFLAMMAIVIGGRGSLMGCALGAIVFVAVPEVMREFEEWRLIGFGVVLIAIVQLAPAGLWPTGAGLVSKAIVRMSPSRLSRPPNVSSPSGGAR